MIAISALLHTCDHSLTLGRALETLYPCDEILIVDHNSRDATLHIAREYGARMIQFSSDAPPGHYLQDASFEWILCLEPTESLSESLAASLYEWKCLQAADNASAMSFFLREETAQGWVDLPAPQTRLVPKPWTRWHGWLPAPDQLTTTLEGRLLRFLTPQF